MGTNDLLTTLGVGQIYTLRPKQIGGYNYTIDYNEGRHIDVRVLKGPNRHGYYKCTTRGTDGRHLGPGGGWAGSSIMNLAPEDVEMRKAL